MYMTTINEKRGRELKREQWGGGEWEALDGRSGVENPVIII